MSRERELLERIKWHMQNYEGVSHLSAPAFIAEIDAILAQPEAEITAYDAVFGFAAWLTCRDETVSFGATSDASLAAELAGTWCRTNNLIGPSSQYPKNITQPAPQQESPKQTRSETPAPAADRGPDAFPECGPKPLEYFQRDADGRLVFVTPLAPPAQGATPEPVTKKSLEPDEYCRGWNHAANIYRDHAVMDAMISELTTLRAENERLRELVKSYQLGALPSGGES